VPEERALRFVVDGDFLRAENNNRVLDVARSKFSEGNPVILFYCHTKHNQWFTINWSDGTISTKHKQNLVLGLSMNANEACLVLRDPPLGIKKYKPLVFRDLLKQLGSLGDQKLISPVQFYQIKSLHFILF
jgi:hypothetical protein